MAKTSIFTRLMSVLLLLAMLVGLMPAITRSMTTTVSAADTTWDVDGDGILSILCIGNSFSVDAMQYVPQIANNLGITNMQLGNLYIGGCTLATHYSNASGDKAAYTYYKNTGGSWSTTASYKMSTALTSRSWDYVSMQQASPNSGQADTYNSNLTNLISYVKGKLVNPSTKLVWHMTWAYQGNSTHSGFANYGKNQTTMYNAIVSATQSKIVTNSNFAAVIPSGTAIQNARSSLIRDNLCRDGYHLNTNIGRYIAGLTFCKAIGLDISAVAFSPANVPNGYKAIAIESATNAVATPFAVTKSVHTDVTTSPYYTRRALSLKANSYWHSNNATYYNKQVVPASTHSNYNKFYSTQRFNSYTLPVGSVILLTSGSGWRYRPEAWLTNAVQTSRPNNTTASYTVCSDEWWKNAENKTYLYRAFNLSKSDGSVLATNLASTINNVFQIWVPKEYITSDLSPEQLYNNLSTLPDPIPNNSRVTWSSPSQIPNISGKYLVVSDQATTGGKYYAWDPLTPRLFETWNAAPVSVSSKSGTQRVYNADPGWGITFTYDATMGYADAGYSSAPAAQTWASFKFQVPKNELDSSKVYLTNEVNYNSSGYPSSLKANVWRLQNSDFYSSLPAATNSSGKTVTNATWVKRFARANLFFNTDSDRFHFIWWPQFREQTSTGAEILIGDKTRRTSVRSIFKDPATEDPYFQLSSDEMASSPVSYVCFFLYKIDTSKGNPEKLYAKLKEAQKYINVEHTYYTAEYNAFLDALNSAYALYISKNGNASTQADFDNAMNNLHSKMKALNAYNEIEYIAAPYNKRIFVNSDAACENGKLEGTYFISRFYNGNMAQVHSFIDRNTLTGGAYGIHRLRVSGSSMLADDLTYAITLRAVEGSTYGYTLQFENGNFLRSSGTSFSSPGRAQSFFISTSDYTGISGGIQIDNTDGKRLFCEAQTNFKWYFRTVGDENENRGDFHLFQCSPTTLELYRALQFIQPYCNQDEAIKRYPADLYREFLADMKDALKAYSDYNNNNYFSNATIRAELEAKAAKLRQWADTLTLADTSISYIDIPVEILDLRADTMLLEYKDATYWGNGENRYTLNGVEDGLTPPGVTTNGYQTGLMEDYLVDNMPVYKPETIAHLAQLIIKDDEDVSNIVNGLKTYTDNYNTDIRAKINSVRSSNQLGDWNSTINKAVPAKNGGVLLWENVTTAYDLAYYALTNLWREVPKTDTLSDGKTYNLAVPERETLRLYKEANQNIYTIFSDNNTVYNGEYIYNTMPVIASPPITTHTDFTPINHLGYESNGVETDLGGYISTLGDLERLKDVNFHYSMHAYGSFVYYEDQNLHFDFVGDDDVYFFINGKLAMDLGGAHSPVSNSLTLNSIKTSHGLEDGGIYTFDMYYIERHTTGSNMKFQTNIKIVDTDTLTTLGQHANTSGDESMIDSDTGMGPDLLDNGLVRVGDIVDYSFNVVNSHDMAVYNMIFENKNLGTYISKDIIDLTNEELTNITTDITDIKVYYRTSQKDDDDNIIVNSDPLQAKSVGDMKAMLQASRDANAVTPGASIPEGSYYTCITCEQDLMDLLELGVPANCQMTVYGFKRKMVEEDANTTIANELAMTCSYLPWASADTELNLRNLTGTASRILKVAALSGIPQAQKVEYVIDYGKPLAIDITNVISNAAGVTNNGFVGFTKSGYNGEFLKAAPKDLDPVMETGSGIFEHRLGNVYYTLTDMLSKVETVYAVYALSGCEITDTAGVARAYPYMLSEITIVPATTMYYETDFDQIEFVGDSSPYVMIDFGSNDKTVWGTATPNNMTGAKVDGVFKGTVSGTDPYIVMDYTTGSALSHKVTSTDVVKVRIKSDPCIGDGLQVFFMTDTNANPAGGISTDIAPYTPNKQWQIITLPIFSDVVGKTIKGIRLDPIGNNNSFQSSGSFEYDWVYIGPDVDDSSMFAYDSGKSSMFETHTTSTANAWQTVGTSHTTLQTPTFADDADTYGYEAAYDNGAILSNNSSMFVIGAGIPRFNTDYTPNYAASANYTETSFSFTGTGFDIISRTGEQQCALRAMIYTEAGKYVKAVSVINTGVLELYQIPVVSVRDLDYGTYQVKIFVNAPYTNSAIPALNRGGEFYFDAVRIYNPLDVTSGTKESKLAYEIYLRHGEADHVVTEMHDILIDANSFTAGGTMDGIAYIDANVLAKNEVDLRFIDNQNYDLVRKQETNLGDFAADALRYVFAQAGRPVDAAIVLGEDIRSNLPLGDVYQTNCAAIHPNGNLACAREITGQQLLDALEWGARWAGLTPTKFFLQVSGISYKIDRNITSTVQKDENNNWCGAPSGEYRVKDVMIGGQPLDPNAVYLIAGYSNILRSYENGFAMFKDAGELHLQPMRDSYVLESYIKSFPVVNGVPTIQANNSVLDADYGNMDGEGRITLIGNDSADPSEGDAIAPTPVVIDKAPAIKNYMHLGPNQEVYLNPNSGIAFKIEATGTLPSRIDIAARSANGKEVMLAVNISNTPPTDLQNAFGVKIISCTAQYYGLGLTEADWSADADGKKFAYATISNNGSGILSITDIKYAYNVTEPATRSRTSSRYLNFLVDRAMLDAYGVCVEHSLTYVDMGDVHEASCSNCEFTEIVEHTLVDGKCVCKAAENTDPIIDETLEFSMNITAGAEIGVNYSIAALSGYTDFRLEVVKDVAGSDPVTTVYGKDGISFTAMTHPTTGEALMYSAKYEGINAKEMGDSFATTLYAVGADGKVYRSETVVSSIKDFLISKIDAPDATAEAKTMAVDMLKYGAAAQVYLNYDAQNLVTDTLTEAQLAYATKEAPTASDHCEIFGEGANVNANITVGSKVELNLSSIIAAVSDPSAVRCVITDADGKVLADLAASCMGGVMYRAKYDNVGAKQMREVIIATFYDGDQVVSKSFRWSVESYVAQTLAKADISDEEANMVTSMLTYGDAIAAYLTSIGQ